MLSYRVVGCALFLFLFGLGLSVPAVHAASIRPTYAGLVDTDQDGIPDDWEVAVFHSDPNTPDSDADQFDDWTEIVNGHNPIGSGNLKETDFDQDGLSDRLELMLATDPTKADTDGDGFSDGHEIASGFSPVSTSTAPLEKKIVISLSKQRLMQMLGDTVLATYSVSTGKTSTPTPKGTFKILSKSPRAWSHMAGLWMPWWMQFTKQGAGLHELPEWPGGKKEGAAHLGKPVSHGCVRLGIGAAEALYDWAPIGTKVVVMK